MECRVGCGACCIVPSISSPIPGMPMGKPAGQRCVQLDGNNHCRLMYSSKRPAVCAQFQASVDVCGENVDDAMRLLTDLETLTR